MICPTCFHPMTSLSCSFCALAKPCLGCRPCAQKAQKQIVRHAVGNIVGQDTSTVQNDATTAAQGNAGQIQTTSWDDLQLLYPFTWPSWLAGKALDPYLNPSSESDPKVRRSKLLLLAQQLNNTVKSCTSLPQIDQTNWSAFGTSFAAWYNQSPGFFTTGDDAMQAQAFQDQLADWQTEIGQYCNTGIPKIPKAAPSLSQIGADLVADVGKYLDTAKVSFIVGGVVVIVLVWAIGRENITKIIAKYA